MRIWGKCAWPGEGRTAVSLSLWPDDTAAAPCWVIGDRPQPSYSSMATLRTVTDTHLGLRRQCSDQGSSLFLLFQHWPRSQSPEMCASWGVPSKGYPWKPFTMGVRLGHSHALSHWSGCCPLAPWLCYCWWELEVPVTSAFPGLLSFLVASFPNKDKGNSQEVQTVTKES